MNYSSSFSANERNDVDSEIWLHEQEKYLEHLHLLAAFWSSDSEHIDRWYIVVHRITNHTFTRHQNVA